MFELMKFNPENQSSCYKVFRLPHKVTQGHTRSHKVTLPPNPNTGGFTGFACFFFTRSPRPDFSSASFLASLPFLPCCHRTRISKARSTRTLYPADDASQRTVTFSYSRKLIFFS